MRINSFFLIFLLLISFAFSSTFHLDLPSSTTATLSSSKTSCSYFTQSTTSTIPFSFEASTTSNLISKSTSLNFYIVSGTERVTTSINNDIPEVINNDLYNYYPVSYSEKNQYFSKYFSDSDFSGFESDYDSCEHHIFTKDCTKIRGYNFLSSGFQCILSSGDTKTPSIKGTEIESYLKEISNGKSNKMYYIREDDNSNLYIVDGETKKGLSFLICNGAVDFISSSKNTINFNNPQTIGDTLPASCFEPDENGLYKESCDIPIEYNVKCYSVDADYYKDTNENSKVHSYVFYSPITLHKSGYLTIDGLCHGTISSSVHSDSVEMEAGTTIPYTFSVENTGDIPIKISSSSDITLTNGFSFEPSSTLSFPIEIAVGQTAIIDGMLTSPSPMPSSFTITVNIYPDKNAVSCDGSQSSSSSVEVSVKEVKPCNILLDIPYTSSLCKGQESDLDFKVKNNGEGDVEITRYNLYLQDTAFYDEPCSDSCIISQGEEQDKTLSGVSTPLTTEDSATFWIYYQSTSDPSCNKIAKTSVPIVDCSQPLSFDLYPDDMNFFNNYQGEETYAKFKVKNDAGSSTPSSPTKVRYRLTSGSNIIDSSFEDVPSLTPGQSTEYYTTDSIICDGSITLDVWVSHVEGDIDSSNDHKTYTESCNSIVQQSGVCVLRDLSGLDVTGTTIYTTPSTTTNLDLYCYDVDNNGVKTATSCSGNGDLYQSGASSISGYLNFDASSNIYDKLLITTDSNANDGDHKSFTITIEKTEPGRIITYSCSVDAESSVSECTNYI